METKQVNGAHVQNGTAKEPIKASSNGEVSKEQANGKAEAAKAKQAAEKTASQEVMTAPTKPVESKSETALAKEEVPAKPVLNLDGRLKVVDELHRKSVQRLNLKSRIKQLEAFEVALSQEHDELEDNPYQGCKLIIEDDKKTQFVTTTPGLIRLVSQFIFDACHEKLAEIEASIVFPNA